MPSLSEMMRAWLLQPAVSALTTLQGTIAMNQAELVEAIVAVGDKLQKIGAESSAMIDEIFALRDLIGQASPEVEAALLALQARAQAVDDLVPDAPVP